jgi:hypothetical protein
MVMAKIDLKRIKNFIELAEQSEDKSIVGRESKKI